MNYALKDFKKIIKNTHQQVRRELSDSGTNCMRVYDRNIGSYPVTVDIYGKYVKIQHFGDGMIDVDEVIEAVSRSLYVPLSRVFYQDRKKRIGRQQHKLADESLESTIGSVEVQEGGLKFLVDLEARIDTGIFLDHMPTRMMVGAQSYGKRVLNLFAYTGAFSVHAAAGGAAKVVTVDLSNTYLQWAEKHLAINGFSGDLYPCVRSDAKKYLSEQAPSDGPFDIIILDPPTFSNGKHASENFKVQRDYIWYIKTCMKHLSKNGSLIFSNNLQGFRFDVKAFPSYYCKDITRESIAPGFSQKRKPHICYVIRHAKD